MDISGIAQASLVQSEARLEHAAKRLAEAPADTVSLSDSVVALLRAKQQFETGAAVLRTAFDMEQSVLDLLQPPAG